MIDERLPFYHDKTDWLEACGVKDFFSEEITLKNLPSFFEKLMHEPYPKQLRITTVLVGFLFFDKNFVNQLISIAPSESLLMEIIFRLVTNIHQRTLKKSEFVEYLEHILSSIFTPNNILIFLQQFLIEIMLKKYIIMTLDQQEYQEYQEDQKEIGQKRQKVIFH
ncbi:MAG: hypothetical protein QXM53_05150 [Thermofilaceae archaeon]